MHLYPLHTLLVYHKEQGGFLAQLVFWCTADCVDCCMQATDKQPSNHYQIHDQQSDPWLVIWLLLDEANLFGDGHTTTSKGALNNECCSCLLPVAPYSTFGLDEIVPMTSKLLPEYCCSLNIPAKSADIAPHASIFSVV